MKYSYTIALFLSIAQADDTNKHQASYSCSHSDAWDPRSNIRESNSYDVQNSELPQGESLATDALNGIAASYLRKNHYNDGFDQTNDFSNQFLEDDKLQNDILCIDNRHERKSDQLIDSDATKVNANFESCHVGETIIPALKEETQVQQAACYSSDSAAQYILKGCANNNYKLSGSMTQNECQVQKGGEKLSTTLCLRGNKNKKYCQNGNKALFGCADGSECGGFGLKAELLDDEALEVTSDPAKRVEEEVNQVVRNAISKTISQAIQFALDEALGETINI